MDTLQIMKYPDPFLRLVAEEISVDDSIEDLIHDMFDVLKEERGIGLAAPQIGVSKRIIVVSLEQKGFERLALINPVIEFLSEKTGVMEEGCLSLPGVNADVVRPLDAVVRGRMKSGREVEFEAHDLFARVLQHEIDHLNGILFIDRITPEEKKRVESGLNDLKSQYASLR
jgi:peptide deformylase